jgi:hypothetical protein
MYIHYALFINYMGFWPPLLAALLTPYIVQCLYCVVELIYWGLMLPYIALLKC